MTIMQELALRKIDAVREIDGKLYKKTYDKVNQQNTNVNLDISFQSPIQIPQKNCVPIMASTQQIESFENVLHLPNMTVNNVLSAFSHSLSPSKFIGKQEFLVDFINELTTKNINFDLGVLCCDVYSEDALSQVCQRNGYNSQKLSILVPSTNTFGLVVKIRKTGRVGKPVTRTEIDLCVIYDSAIPYSPSVFQQLKSVSSRRPFQRISLTTMDTPDIRIFCSETSMDWSTKIQDLESDVKQQLFLQRSRRPSLSHATTWNKHMAKDVANWAAKLGLTSYKFEFPAANRDLMRIYNMFPWRHPIPPSSTKIKKEESPAEKDSTAVIVIEDDDNMDVEEEEEENNDHPVAVTEKRDLETDETNIPNKKQKATTTTEVVDYDLMLQQALADFENEINQL